MDKKNISHTHTGKHALLISGAVSNYLGYCVTIFINLFLTPFLIRHLGKAQYGMWILVYSLPIYYSILKFGAGAGFMRYVPPYLIRDDHESITEMFGSGLALGLISSLLIFLASQFIAEPLARFFKCGGELATLVRIIGCVAAIGTLSELIIAAIKARERWIIVNVVVVTTNIVLALSFVGTLCLSQNLIAMSYMYLAITICSLAVWVIVFKRVYQRVKINFLKYVDLMHARKLVSYGFFVMIIGLLGSASAELPNMVIGRVLSLEAVALYGVIAALIMNIEQAASVGVSTLWPRFAYMNNANCGKESAELFIKSTKLIAIAASGVMLTVLICGTSFIRLWVGSGFESAYPVFIILAIGCLIKISNMASPYMLMGLGRQRAYAMLLTIQWLFGFILGLLLVFRFGMVGFACGFTMPVIIVSGLIIPAYAGRMFKFSVLSYFRDCLLKPWSLLAILAMLIYYVRLSALINSWLSLIMVSMLVLCVYTFCAQRTMTDGEGRKKISEFFEKALRRVCAS